jgi:hypothetical protein
MRLQATPSAPSAEEIAEMLSYIPPQPDYNTWLRICSAVWSVLPMEEGCRVLKAWSPELREGEYAAKYRYRLHSITIGTLVYLAKLHGYRSKCAVLFAEMPRQTLRRTPRTLNLAEAIKSK